MTVGELKAKLEDYPSDWVIRIHQNDIPVPINGFLDILDLYVEGQGEVGIIPEPEEHDYTEEFYHRYR